MTSQISVTNLPQSEMRCLVKDNLALDGLTYRVNYPVPKPGPLHVKIKVLSAGICGTDKSIFHSSQNEGIRKEMLRYAKDGVFQPIIIGHEFCGIVSELGDGLLNGQNYSEWQDVGIEVGDYVTAEAHVACGRCATCLSGSSHLCVNLHEHGIHLDGSFADYITVPFGNVILLGKGGVNPDIPPRIGAILDAFGNAVHMVDEAQVGGKTVAILGAGPIGLMCVLLARKLGAAKILVSDAVDIARKFEVATSLGADLCFDVSKGSQSMYEKISNSLSSSANGVDVVMEVSGAASAYVDALHLVRNGGQVLLLGLPAKPISQLDIANGIIFKGVTVKGIFGRKMFSTWQTMLQLLEQDRHGIKEALLRIISKKSYSLENFQAAFNSFTTGEEMKIVFDLTMSS